MTDKFVNEEHSTTLLFYSLAVAHIFTGISFFFIMAAFHGNLTVGKRFATFTFYHMQNQETLLNSFLVNTTLMNVMSCGVK